MSENRSPMAKNVVIALLAAALAAALLLIGLGGSGQAAAPGTQRPAPFQKPSVAAPQPADPSQPAAEPQSDAESQAEPQAEPQADPEPQPEPGVLSVGPAGIDLPDGQWTAQFVVANVGGSEMSWFAVGVPSEVGLSETEGTLAAGTETVVTATIDHTQLEKGPFDLTLHVSANDTAESVTFTGVKKIKVVAPKGPGDITLG
jgi:hypothetical protein